MDSDCSPAYLFQKGKQRSKEQGLTCWVAQYRQKSPNIFATKENPRLRAGWI